MKQFLVTLCAVAVLPAVVPAQDEEKKFNVYGFMDVLASQQIIDDNSLFKTVVADEFRISLDHVNVYFDMAPNAHTRFLGELGYRSEPADRKDRLGRTVVADIYGVGRTETVVTTPERAAANMLVSPEAGEVLDWGSFSLERAWFELRANQYVNVRFGKFITPAGIWNVDHGSPVITTVHQPYEASLIAIFPKSQVGVMNTGVVYLGNIDLDYNLYVSSGRLGFDLEDASDLAGGANMGVLLPVFNGLRIGASGFGGMQKQTLTNQVITVTVDEAAVTGFTMDAMTSQGVMNPYDPAVTAAVQNSIEQYIETAAVNPDNHRYDVSYDAKSREYAAGGDLKLSVGGFSLQSEINHQVLYNRLDGGAATRQTGFYGLVSYAIPAAKWLKITPYVMYERIRSIDADNNPQVYLSNSGVDGFQTYLGGLNVRLFTNVTMKIEYAYHDIMTFGYLADYDNEFDLAAVRGQFSIAF